MADRHTRAQRSWNMSRIRASKNASTEERLVILFRKNRIVGWRRKFPLPGRPDFAFPRQRLLVFVDGCFWHCCPRCNWTPTTNVAYWTWKFNRNRRRDRAVDRTLRASDWSVMRIWEHSIREAPERVVRRIFRKLQELAEPDMCR